MWKKIPERYLQHSIRAEGKYSIGSCSDGVDNNYDGKIDKDGVLHFCGRMDRQIKHMGHRVELDEVEHAANVVDGVDESCVIYNKQKEVLMLFFSGECEKRQLAIALREELPGFMVPRKIKKLEQLPKLPNGKYDMKKLEEM